MDSVKLNENWNEVCNLVCSYEGVEPSQFKAFFYRLQPQALSEGFLMLTSDNDFIKSWVERHYLDAIRRALSQLHGGIPFTVIIEVDPGSAASAATTGPSGVSTAGAAQTMASSSAMPAPSAAPVIEARPADPLPTQASPAIVPGMGTSLPDQAATYYPPAERGEDARTLPPLDFPAPGAAPCATAAGGAAEGPSSTLTFENFVIGDSNRMAYSMALNVAEQPGHGPLNPLFIYGKSGLGKTHLMFAIQNYIRETQPQLRTVYVDSSDMLTDYMEAGAAHDKEKSSYKNFKARYEEADVLLIDDIQYLQGKKQTLDIVFQIFNSLINQRKQIILSADRAPKNIDIDERYHSRFSQGGTVDIQPPEIETKLGIVKSFIDEYCRTEGLEHFSIPQDVQMYIAENSSSNIRELKGAVTTVIYQMTVLQQPNFSVADVRSLLENHFSGGASRNLSLEDIQKEVEAFFKVKHSDLVGKSRARQITYPRQIAMYLCRQILDVPFNAIGEKFNRDHSTVLHAVKQVEEMMKQREVQEEIETLTQIIREI